MAVLQPAFNERQAPYFAGMILDMQLSNTTTYTLEGSTNCAFGRGVFRGTYDKGCDLVATASQFIGFAVQKKGQVIAGARTLDAYAPGDNVLVEERAPIVTTSATAANKYEPVYIVAATGEVSNVASGNIATGWEFWETITAAGPVPVRKA
jgi:hypothetical protein